MSIAPGDCCTRVCITGIEVVPPTHAHVTPRLAVQISAEAVSVINACSFTAFVGVTLKTMFVGVNPAVRLCGTADVHNKCAATV